MNPSGIALQPSKQVGIIEHVILLFIAAILSLLILMGPRIVADFWPSIVALISVLLGILLLYLQGFFSRSLSQSEISATLLVAPQEKYVQFTIFQRNSTQLTLEEKITYHRIRGVPPPTDSRTIQQRDEVVKDLYAKLIQPNISALILTGIAGVGKSTLAALLYQHIEERRQADSGLFAAETLWLTIDKSTTMTDLAGTIFDALDKPLADFNHLPLKEQAWALFDVLSKTNKARLVILDQFDNLLDWHTGRVNANRLGISEWLDILNSHPSQCNKVLITSRPRPLGFHKPPSNCMQEYPVKGLEVDEAVELLRKHRVKASEEELRKVAISCEGHALSLTLLISTLRDSYSFELEDFAYMDFWRGSIARNLLDGIYKKQMNAVERQLLLAFSVYREPVSLDAAERLVDVSPNISKLKILSAFEALLIQNLLHTSSDQRNSHDDLYQLHTIVANYAKEHFVEANEKANQHALQTAHAKAAQYYLQQASENHPPRGRRKHINDVHPLIEAVRHICLAEQWGEAYKLMYQEYLFSDLKLWGGYEILLELCKLLLPLDKWHPERSQVIFIYINLGEIYRVLGDLDQARKYDELALEASRAVGDRAGEGRTLKELGLVYGILGEKKRAQDLLKQALNISRLLKDRRGEGKILDNLGWIYRSQEQQKLALKYYRQALSISRTIEDREWEGRSLNGLGLVYISNEDQGISKLLLRIFCLLKIFLKKCRVQIVIYHKAA